jgi:hypothetical protein
LWRGVGPLVVGLLAGCSSKEDEASVCKEGSTCGGDLVGAWHTTEDACVSSPEATVSTDPCAELRLDPADPTVAFFRPDYSDLKLRGLSVLYNTDGNYNAGVWYEGRKQQRFDASCLPAGLPTPACVALRNGLELTLLSEGSGSPNVSCTDYGKGCDCSYTVSYISGVSGTFSVQGGVVNHSPSSFEPNAMSSDSQFCVRDDRLALGPQPGGGGVFGRPNLQRLALDRINCNDGLAGKHEEGIDCGGACPLPCQ